MWHGHGVDNVTSNVEGVVAADFEHMTQACIWHYRAEAPWKGMCLDYIDPSVTNLVHPSWKVAGERGQLVSWRNCRMVDTMCLCPKRGTTMLLAQVLMEQKC